MTSLFSNVIRAFGYRPAPILKMPKPNYSQKRFAQTMFDEMISKF